MSKPHTINAATAAKCCGITVRRLQQLVNAGELPRHDRGKYIAVDVFPAFLKYDQANRDASGGGTAASDPANELTMIRVQRARMELATAQRRLVPVEALGYYAEKLAAIMQAALETMPGQIKQLIPHLRTGEIKAIRSLIVKTQNGIAAVNLNHSRAA